MRSSARQILKNFLLPLLHLKEDRLSQQSVVPRRMNLSRFQQNVSQVGYTLLRCQHLLVG